MTRRPNSRDGRGGGAGHGGGGRGGRPGGPRRRNAPRDFNLTDRVAEQIRKIVATELERIGDERLDLVTVTDVRVVGDYSAAEVFYSALTATDDARPVEQALTEVTWPIQRVVNREVRARRTPQIRFVHDDVLESALLIEQKLHDLGPIPEHPDEPDPDAVGEADASTTPGLVVGDAD